MASRMATISSPRVIGSLRRIYGISREYPILPLLIVVTMGVLAAFAPLIAPRDPYDINLTDRNAPPVWYSAWYEEHPRTEYRYILGADYVGRDVLSRIIYGARISLSVSGIAIAAGMTVGATLGLVSGYFGGLVDELCMRLVDVWLSLPFILVAMVIAMTLGSKISVIMGVLALMAWAVFVRNVRAEVLSLKARDYVALARVSGASSFRIIIRHILPNVVNTIVVLATFRVGQLIMAEASLSFLGAGIPSPTPAWGLMVSEGRDFLRTAWWTTVFPGIFIFLLVMALNFMGDWFRDRIDPRLRQL